MDARDQFLSDVAARLPLPDDQRAEILEELAAHLSDSTEDLIARGVDPVQAEAEALHRVGAADELARALLHSRRTQRQLLDAAGAGIWAAVRTGVHGALVGWVLAALAGMLITIAIQAITRIGGTPVLVNWSPGWNSVVLAAGLAIGALFAGAAAVRVVSARTWRLPPDVQRAVAAAGVAVIGFLTLVVLQQSLNWASVLAFLVVPMAFVVGARLERIRPPSALLLLLGLIGVFALLSASAGLVSGAGSSGYSWSSRTHGYEMIAPWWQAPGSAGASDFPSGGSGTSGLGIETINVQAASEAVIAEFHAFRFEAWKAEAPGDGWRLVPGQTRPFATAAAVVGGTTVSGTIRFNQTPGVEWAQVVLTAVGPDGRRYLLTASGPEQTGFYGSVWAWFAALTH